MVTSTGSGETDANKIRYAKTNLTASASASTVPSHQGAPVYWARHFWLRNTDTCAGSQQDRQLRNLGTPQSSSSILFLARALGAPLHSTPVLLQRLLRSKVEPQKRLVVRVQRRPQTLHLTNEGNPTSTKKRHVLR